MKRLNSIVLLAMIMLVSACSSNKVNIETEYSKATNFNDFKYYRWHQGDHAKGAVAKQKKGEEKSEQQIETDALFHQNIRYMIEQQLAKQGMTKKEEGQVDFLVDYSGGAISKSDVEVQKVYDNYATNYQTYSGGGYGYSGRYYSGVGVSMTMETSAREELMVDRYREGTMMIDFFEPDDKTLIWRAIADKRLDKKQVSSVEREKLIKSVIEKLLAKFPPK